MNQNPIFVLGCHKSGTSLLRNLLDGHKDLFVIPTETHFFANIGYPVRYSFRTQHPQELNFEEMRSNLINWIEKRNRVEDSIGDGFTKDFWNIDELKKYLNEYSVSNIKELSDAFHSALYKSLYSTELPEEKRVVEKSVENSEFVAEWLNFYPKAKFIHIVRNPYSNLVSLRKYVARRTKHPKTFFGRRDSKHFPHLRHPVTSMKDSFHDLVKNEKIYKNYLFVKYEDLLASTEAEITRITEFIDIEFDECLLTPTIFNETWKGNSIRDQKFSGVSSANLENWKNEITDFEINIVNNLFGYVLGRFNYERIEPKNNSIWKRAPKESLANYLLNRYLVHYSLH